jgi:WD40 repeat protein
MANVFISYSRKDKEIARRLTEALKGQDLDFWIDWEGIEPTVDWWQEIEKGIESADNFLFLISPDSTSSKVCKREIEHAVKNGKRLIPLVVRDVKAEEVPEALRLLNWIFLRETDDFQTSFGKLIKAIQTNYEWLKYHTELQVKALKWKQQEDNTSRLLRGKELQESEQQLANAGTAKEPQPTDIQRQYVFASRREEDRQHRRITLSLAFGLAIVALLAVFAWSQTTNALNSEATAIAQEHAKATALVQERHARETAAAERQGAEEPELDTRPDLALLLAAEAAKKNHNYSTLDRLLRVLQYKAAPYTFFFGHKEPVTALTFSADSQQIASASEDHTVHVWNRSTGGITAEMDIGVTVTALRFGPDDRYLLIGTNDTVRIWDMKASNWMGQFSTGHTGTLTGMAFHPQGDELVVSYEDGKILLFDFSSTQLTLQIDAPSRVDGLAFNADGSLLAGGYAVDVFTWDTKTGEMVKSYYEFGGFAKGLRFTSDNELYAYGSWQGVFQIRNVETREIIFSLEKPPEWFSAESLSEDGQWLITSGYGRWVGTILVWDTSGHQQMNFSIRKPSSVAKCLSFSPDSRYLALSGGGQDVQVLDKDSEFQQFTFPSTSAIQCARFVSDRLLLAYDQDNRIRHLDVNTRKETSTSLRISDEIIDLNAVDTTRTIAAIMTCKQKNQDDRCIRIEIEYYDTVANKVSNSISFETNSGNTALSSKGNLFAIGNPEPKFTLALWNLSVGIEKGQVLSGPLNWILDITFSPDENYLAASSQGDGLIYLWNLGSNQVNGDMLRGHDYMAPALAFSPDGELLVSAGCNQRSGMGCSSGEIRIWHVESHQVIGKPFVDTHKNWIGQLVFSHDGNLLISSDFEGKIEGWPIGYESWIDKACQRAGRNLTQAEWTQYFPDEPYRLTCLQWPAGE